MFKLLLPVDGSESLLNTLRWAVKSLDKTTHQFYLLYVITPNEDCSIVEHLKREAQEALSTARTLVEKSGFQVGKVESRMGTPWEEICTYADEVKPDLILMGSHGRTKLAKVLMGSVSQKVMEHCKHPLLIYREKERITD